MVLFIPQSQRIGPGDMGNQGPKHIQCRLNGGLMMVSYSIYYTCSAFVFYEMNTPSVFYEMKGWVCSVYWCVFAYHLLNVEGRLKIKCT